jgi:hypothetical protein
MWIGRSVIGLGIALLVYCVIGQAKVQRRSAGHGLCSVPPKAARFIASEGKDRCAANGPSGCH